MGRMFFSNVTQGCIEQVQSAYSGGIAVVDCAGGIDQIDPSDPVQKQRLGRICVGSGGHDACDRVVPVESSTWGQIRATYGPRR